LTSLITTGPCGPRLVRARARVSTGAGACIARAHPPRESCTLPAQQRTPPGMASCPLLQTGAGARAGARTRDRAHARAPPLPPPPPDCCARQRRTHLQTAAPLLRLLIQLLMGPCCWWPPGHVLLQPAAAAAARTSPLAARRRRARSCAQLPPPSAPWCGAVSEVRCRRGALCQPNKAHLGRGSRHLVGVRGCAWWRGVTPPVRCVTVTSHNSCWPQEPLGDRADTQHSGRTNHPDHHQVGGSHRFKTQIYVMPRTGRTTPHHAPSPFAPLLLQAQLARRTVDAGIKHVVAASTPATAHIPHTRFDRGRVCDHVTPLFLPRTAAGFWSCSGHTARQQPKHQTATAHDPPFTMLPQLVRQRQQAHRLAAALQAQCQRGIADAMRSEVRHVLGQALGPLALAGARKRPAIGVFHGSQPRMRVCVGPPQPQTEPLADLQPAYSYVPPGRNHLYVPGGFAPHVRGGTCVVAVAVACGARRCRSCITPNQESLGKPQYQGTLLQQ
jgi:hypothetical protein